MWFVVDDLAGSLREDAIDEASRVELRLISPNHLKVHVGGLWV
jgi:hypothetical protein